MLRTLKGETLMGLKSDLVNVSVDGEALAKGTDSLLKLMPGRKIVSIARANRKTEQIFTECINDLVREAKVNGWSNDLLAWRVQSAAESFGKRMNLEEIVGRATKLLDEGREFDARTMDGIDSEWMAALVDHAERTTDENMRDVIAAILAGESNKPGSYSKGTVATLTRMDAGQISMFEKVCRHIVYPCFYEGTTLVACYDDPLLVLNRDESGSSYANGAIAYQEIMELGILGLVSQHSTRWFTLNKATDVAFLVGEEYAVISHDDEKELSFNIVLTRTGVELSRLFEGRDHDVLCKQLNQKAEQESLSIAWIAYGQHGSREGSKSAVSV